METKKLQNCSIIFVTFGFFCSEAGSYLPIPKNVLFMILMQSIDYLTPCHIKLFNHLRLTSPLVFPPAFINSPNKSFSLEVILVIPHRLLVLYSPFYMKIYLQLVLIIDVCQQLVL